mmetsp:Transcript_64025/g.177639  ORF Transcript_64025/g.177639 Transcript_64025/m.177639 type:complete len:213 (-) Transcript_64025:633-1271(-)
MPPQVQVVEGHQQSRANLEHRVSTARRRSDRESQKMLPLCLATNRPTCGSLRRGSAAMIAKARWSMHLAEGTGGAGEAGTSATAASARCRCTGRAAAGVSAGCRPRGAAPRGAVRSVAWMCGGRSPSLPGSVLGRRPPVSPLCRSTSKSVMLSQPRPCVRMGFFDRFASRKTAQVCARLCAPPSLRGSNFNRALATPWLLALSQIPSQPRIR